MLPVGSVEFHRRGRKIHDFTAAPVQDHHGFVGGIEDRPVVFFPFDQVVDGLSLPGDLLFQVGDAPVHRLNLGGIDGLVHVSELSWGRIEDPEEVYKVGQRLKVEVLNVDRDRQRIGLSLKALQSDPWESVGERHSVGDLVEGTVSQVVDFGIFVELEPGIEGLLHNSELISPSQRDELKSGDKILVKIIRIEPHRRRIGLSVKQVRLHEWEAWHAEHEQAPAELAPSSIEVEEEEEEQEPEPEPEAEPAEEEAEEAEAIETDVADESDDDAESNVDAEEDVEEEKSSETEVDEA